LDNYIWLSILEVREKFKVLNLGILGE